MTAAPAVAVFGILRFPPELLEEVQPHLQAPHIEPWCSAARACGLQERQFTAYDIGGSRSV